MKFESKSKSVFTVSLLRFGLKTSRKYHKYSLCSLCFLLSLQVCIKQAFVSPTEQDEEEIENEEMKSEEKENKERMILKPVSKNE